MNNALNIESKTEFTLRNLKNHYIIEDDIKVIWNYFIIGICICFPVANGDGLWSPSSLELIYNL